jgi:hypothetical protein
MDPSTDVSGWRLEEKLGEAMRRSQPYMPAEIWTELQAFLTLESLSIMATVTAAWAISHFFGVGEIADGVLLVAGGALMGVAAADVGRETLAFALGARSARTLADLDDAGKHFAAAVVRAGIAALSALFFLRRPPVFREMFFDHPVTVPEPGPRVGRIFYQPSVTFGALPQPNPDWIMQGGTDLFGNIVIDFGTPAEEVAKVISHESVHRFFTPRLYFLRNVRIKIAREGYNRSYLLRYLEEALSQGWTLLRRRGVVASFEGISFPVKNGYVGMAEMGSELHGIAMGTVLFGGNTHRVVFNLAQPLRRDPRGRGQHRRR